MELKIRAVRADVVDFPVERATADLTDAKALLEELST
jgi:hypothetical protein